MVILTSPCRCGGSKGTSLDCIVLGSLTVQCTALASIVHTRKRVTPSWHTESHVCICYAYSSIAPPVFAPLISKLLGWWASSQMALQQCPDPGRHSLPMAACSAHALLPRPQLQPEPERQQQPAAAQPVEPSWQAGRPLLGSAHAEPQVQSPGLPSLCSTPAQAMQSGPAQPAGSVLAMLQC